MTTGNINVSKNEGLFYVDYDTINVYQNINDKTQYRTADHISEDEHDEFEIDTQMSQTKYDKYINLFQKTMQKRFKSLVAVNQHPKNGKYAKHIILKNDMFEVAVIDNEWSFGIALLKKPHYARAGLQKGLLKPFINGMRECLVETFGTIYVRTGAYSQIAITKDNQKDFDDWFFQDVKLDKNARPTSKYPIDEKDGESE